jgi:hypothetical protein
VPLGASRGNGYWGSTRYRTLNFASLASQIEGIDRLAGGSTKEDGNS